MTEPHNLMRGKLWDAKPLADDGAVGATEIRSVVMPIACQDNSFSAHFKNCPMFDGA